MIEPESIFKAIIEILNINKGDYKLFTHRPALSYNELLAVQKETGFVGTEGKCLVIKVDYRFVVYVTVQGEKADLERIKEISGASKIRLATNEELRENFAALPGCAYPFGFSTDVSIFVDPVVYDQKWFLFSPAVPTATIQIRGSDLKKVFHRLPNRIVEIS